MKLGLMHAAGLKIKYRGACYRAAFHVNHSMCRNWRQAGSKETTRSGRNRSCFVSPP
ncbi:hypothetical protein EMEDMD4_420013 [Sinorhizobium medicae]|uniref:Uncharacterized protein n=1 Tax=Sinorhizobium medicae TaxID=110321 RepID=A0A508WYK4_9HYPH|nr:hypothetical protein EMEDMD4_420013 [Sinorhizobium medicae]